MNDPIKGLRLNNELKPSLIRLSVLKPVTLADTLLPTPRRRLRYTKR
ncbi:hypothetical protein [Paenibacillus glycanilyticus]|nr:hypothetical protein [Paenibacillus glycanilyticus]MCK9862635.1 hypothetical protein [Paenibacillus sp. ATY16]